MEHTRNAVFAESGLLSSIAGQTAMSKTLLGMVQEQTNTHSMHQPELESMYGFEEQTWTYRCFVCDARATEEHCKSLKHKGLVSNVRRVALGSVT